ncbi:hypothetical protein Q4R49_20325, partial [Morganella morganii subsp. sibonii]
DDVAFFDIGIKYKNINNNLNIYLPFELTRDEYDGELCSRMCRENELLSTLFNNVISNESKDSSVVSKIQFSNNKDDSINIIKNLSLSSEDSIGDGVEFTNMKEVGGCCLTFPTSILKSYRDEYGYIRFRLILDHFNRKKMSTFYKAKDRLFVAKDEMVELI